jgi:hypothetical protein
MAEIESKQSLNAAITSKNQSEDKIKIEHQKTVLIPNEVKSPSARCVGVAEIESKQPETVLIPNEVKSLSGTIEAPKVQARCVGVAEIESKRPETVLIPNEVKSLPSISPTSTQAITADEKLCHIEILKELTAEIEKLTNYISVNLRSKSVVVDCGYCEGNGYFIIDKQNSCRCELCYGLSRHCSFCHDTGVVQTVTTYRNSCEICHGVGKVRI